MRETVIKIYRKWFGVPAGMGPRDAGVETVLDGVTAVAITEACIADNGVIAPAFLAGDAGLAWQSEQSRQKKNVFGRLLDSNDAEGPRGILAQANGLSQSGRRAAVFVDSPDLVAAQDLVQEAAGRRLPLVIHVTNRVMSAQGVGSATGHEALHQVLDSGCSVLFARTVQQAVDYTVIARRVAEASLLPVLVVMDKAETAASMQSVHLLSPGLIQRYLGRADEQVSCSSMADKLLWGARRRRVPCWHDLDRPVLQGALLGGEAFGLGQAARQVFSDPGPEQVLDEAYQAFARETGRDYQALNTRHLKKAETLLLVQGAAAEIVCQAAELIRKQTGKRVGVVSIDQLRPLPAAELVALFRRRKQLVVLERVPAALAEDSPLMRELRALMDKAAENGRSAVAEHPRLPSLHENERPLMHSVLYGMGGVPLRTGDLLELGKSLDTLDGRRRYLGIDFTRSAPDHPKRQVLLDVLRRDYPELGQLGIRSGEPVPRIGDGFKVVIRGQVGISGVLQGEFTAFLQQLLNGHLCSQTSESSGGWGSWRTETVSYAAEQLPVISMDQPADLVLAMGNSMDPAMLNDVAVSDNSVLIVETETDAAARAAGAGYLLSTNGLDSDEKREARLGALLAVLATQERLNAGERKIVSVREAYLQQQSARTAERLLAAFVRGMESLTPVEPVTGNPGQPVTVNAKPVPMVVRHLSGDEETYDSLPRFWDQTGILYRDGQQSQLSPDPYLATGTMPPLTSTFRDYSKDRSLIPAIQVEACTGCGDCWTSCPDGAIGAVAVSPTVLIKGGISQGGADALRPLAAKLGGRISARARQGEFQSANFESLLKDAAIWLQEKAPLAGERKAAVEAAIGQLSDTFGALPLMVTDPLFNEGEKAARDGGELLALAINPDACKACGLCVAVCTDQAMTVAVQDEKTLRHSRRLWQSWELTPDTGSATIARVADHPEMGPMAAQLLSRYSLLALASGDGAEPGSGEKVAARLALATVEYRQQPLLVRFAGELAQAREKIGQAIRGALVDALPTEDLDALSNRLAGSDSRQVDVSELLASSADTLDQGAVDRTQLTNLTNLALQLADQHHRITRGVQGLGRARYGLTLAHGALLQWAAAFPYNPFQAPVAVDGSGESAQLAAGLLRGQLEEMVQTIRLLRKARMATGDMGRHAPDPDTLQWQDLEPGEQALCPPMLLLGNEQTLGGRNFSQVAWLLNSGLPIKILVLSELDFGLDTQGVTDKSAGGVTDPRGNLGLLALSQRNAYVAQTAISEPDHYQDAVRQALAYPGPALVRVHAPSPARHGFTTDRTLEQARLAVRSRAFPLFTYDPQAEGVFGLRLELQGNPARGAYYASSDEEQALTPVHWAFTEQRFAGHFQPLADDDVSPTVLTDWVAMGPESRIKKTPIISIQYGDSEGSVFKVSESMALMAAQQMQVWQTLQELAGIVTPFTERVAAEARDRVAQKHATELKVAQEQCATQVAETRTGVQQEMAEKIRAQLMRLAGY